MNIFVRDHMVISDVSYELLAVVSVNLTGWKLALFGDWLQHYIMGVPMR